MISQRIIFTFGVSVLVFLDSLRFSWKLISRWSIIVDNTVLVHNEHHFLTVFLFLILIIAITATRVSFIDLLLSRSAVITTSLVRSSFFNLSSFWDIIIRSSLRFLRLAVTEILWSFNLSTAVFVAIIVEVIAAIIWTRIVVSKLIPISLFWVLLPLRFLAITLVLLLD